MLPATGLTNDLGLDYPGDRLYHRGHTWVKLEEDGMVSIGLDAFADPPDWETGLCRVTRHRPGTRRQPGTWRIQKSGRKSAYVRRQGRSFPLEAVTTDGI